MLATDTHVILRYAVEICSDFVSLLTHCAAVFFGTLSMVCMHCDCPLVVHVGFHELFMAACVADADIIFLPCGFFFLSIFFFPRQNLSRCRLDVYHTSTNGVALVRI